MGNKGVHWSTEEFKKATLKMNRDIVLGKTNTKPSKMRNVKCECDGIKFDSKKEMSYYLELKLRKQAGDIKDFECQYKIHWMVKCSGLGPPYRTFEKQYCYIADFRVINNDGSVDIIDVKGNKSLTREFKHKAMIVKKLYNIDIKIV